MEKLPKILIVDDNPANLLAMEAVLEGPDRELVSFESGKAVVEYTQEHDAAVILLDVQMPDLDGYETIRLLRRHPKSKHIPVIFVTAINKEERHVLEGYDSGALDYIFKPFDKQILKSKVRRLIEIWKRYEEQKQFYSTY